MDKLPNELWVIIRSTGEYSDRFETAIRYCLTEADAQIGIALIEIEKQRDVPPRYPTLENTYSFHSSDGTPTRELSLAEKGSWRPVDDHEEIEARNAAKLAEYQSAIDAFGHVDPGGSWSGDHYYYQRVTFWAP